MNKINVAITGGAGVLCKSMAECLLNKGYQVALLDVNDEAVKNAASELSGTNDTKCIGIKTDVLSKASLEAAKEKIEQELGSVSILINGAGGNHPKGTTANEFFQSEDLQGTDLQTFFDLDFESIQFVFNLNFLGTLLPCQVFARDMMNIKDACIVNISSMNAFTPLTKIPAYSAAKASVSNFTQWLAVHFSRMGVRVNAMAPGFFLTAQNHELLLDSSGNLKPRANKIIDHTPLGRFGKPEDLDSTLLWLIDPKSSFITGIVVPIDGGFSAYSGV